MFDFLSTTIISFELQRSNSEIIFIPEENKNTLFIPTIL